MLEQEQAEQVEEAEETPAPDAAETTADERTLTQADLDKAIKERLARERKKFADYEELKTKAAEYDKVVEAQKSEAEKQAERLARAEADAEAARAEAMRLKVLAEVGLDPELHAFVIGDTEEEMRGRAEILKAKTAADPPPRKAPDLKQGIRGKNEPPQVTREQLSTMSPEEIVKAKAEGRLSDVLGAAK